MLHGRVKVDNSDNSLVSNISLSTVYSNFNTIRLSDNDTFTLDSNSGGTLSKADRKKSTRYVTHPNFKTVKSRGTKAKKEQVYEKQMLLARFKLIQQYLEDKMSRALSDSDTAMSGGEAELSGNSKVSCMP